MKFRLWAASIQIPPIIFAEIQRLTASLLLSLRRARHFHTQMTRSRPMHSNHFDYERVIKRLKHTKQVNQERKPRPKAKLAPLRSIAPRKPVAPPAPSTSLLSRAGRILRDESKQLIAASLALLGFGVWLCSSAQALYAQHVEATLAGACHENQLDHAAEQYCFDGRRIVHVLKPDGTATKPGLDWRVNEAALRRAEAAARVAAHEANPGEF